MDGRSTGIFAAALTTTVSHGTDSAMHVPRSLAATLLPLLGMCAVACTTARLTSHGSVVRAELSPPTEQGYAASQCKVIGTVIGKGGGSFGGGLISNEKLLEYALNDLRNKAGSHGANFVHYTTPQFGMSGGKDGSDVSSAMITGTAFRCEGQPSREASVLASSASAAPGSDVRSAARPGGHKYLSVNLRFDALMIQLSFNTNAPNTIWWEMHAQPRIDPACKSVVVADGATQTYAFDTAGKGRAYYQLTLDQLEQLANAQRVAGRVCEADWRWNARHGADAKEFVLQIKEELALRATAAN